MIIVSNYSLCQIFTEVYSGITVANDLIEMPEPFCTTKPKKKVGIADGRRDSRYYFFPRPDSH